MNGWSVNLGCLKFDLTASSYSNSKTLCTSFGSSYPVEIYNQDQQDFIKSYANSLVSAGTIAGTHGWWIGNIYFVYFFVIFITLYPVLIMVSLSICLIVCVSK